MKKKSCLLITRIVVILFIAYQIYFFISLSAEKNGKEVVLPDNDIRETHNVIKGIKDVDIAEAYRADNKYQFKCINSDQHIPYESVNDDYCDCEDGTDEPSTNACSNGVFHCSYPHPHRDLPTSIPSSMVNDGICDCCDGSDEWLDSQKKVLTQGSAQLRRHYATKCPNLCSSSSNK
ncbi:hypothetical protein JYU34_004707 [Plutella xylostella]|uniref:Glucosidase II beta subunit N-terminal domain-containing protein n=1 Tax=Plutella xylostella TaxID=51655 RepID=A0ABQ7QYS4_PLUXY|nr:hypothetical protein JYU34_004707 [Plutella xylostella]